MSFVHGRDTHVYFDELDLTPYLNAASRSSKTDTAETTTYSRRHKSYIPGMTDGSVSIGGLWDGGEDAVDAMLEPKLALPDSKPFTIFTSTAPTIGDRVYGMGEGYLTGYDVSSPVGDVTSMTGEIAANGGVFSGNLLLAKSAVVNADANFATVQAAAATSIGYVATLHVLANTLSLGATFSIEHSDDGTTWEDLVTFDLTATATTEGQVKRAGPNTTVEAYVRAVVDVATGTPTGSINAVVAFHRLTIPGAS